MSVEIYQSEDLGLEVQIKGDEAIIYPLAFLRWSAESVGKESEAYYGIPQKFVGKNLNIHQVIDGNTHTYKVLEGKSIMEWLEEDHFGRI